jgi:hypothetical protein
MMLIQPSITSTNFHIKKFSKVMLVRYYLINIHEYLVRGVDGLVVSALALSTKSARGSRHEPRSGQTLTSLGVTVQWLEF